MSYRSLGKQIDWDFEKFRMASKPSDKGNRRRFFKNFARLFKNPTGYLYWKNYKSSSGFPKIISTLMITGLLFNFFYCAHISKNKKAQ